MRAVQAEELSIFCDLRQPTLRQVGYDKTPPLVHNQRKLAFMLEYFTLVHVLISLAGIGAGFGALAGWIEGKLLPRWTAVFLAMTVATSVTGFFFPFRGFTPAIGVGILSLQLLGAAIYALYFRQLAGVWRKVFVTTGVASQYLNFFVLVTQMFQKFPAFQALAPTQSEPAFAVTHALVLAVFVALGVACYRRIGSTTASW